MNYRVIADSIKREVAKSVNGHITVIPYNEWGDSLTFNISIELYQYGLFWYSFALNEKANLIDACKCLAADVVESHKKKILEIFFKNA